MILPRTGQVFWILGMAILVLVFAYSVYSRGFERESIIGGLTVGFFSLLYANFYLPTSETTEYVVFAVAVAFLLGAVALEVAGRTSPR